MKRLRLTGETSDFSSDVTTVFNTDTDNSLGYGVGTDSTYYSFELGYDIVLDAPAAGRYVRLINSGFIDKSGSYNGYVNVSELEVYAAEAAETEPELSVSKEEITLNVNGDREFIQIMTDQATPNTAAVVTSGDEQVAAAVNHDGIIQITAAGKGDTVITVQHPENEALKKEIAVHARDLKAREIIDDSDESIHYEGEFVQYNTGRGPDPDDGDNPDDGNKPDDGNNPDDGDNPDDGNNPDDGQQPTDDKKPNTDQGGKNQTDKGNQENGMPKTGDTTSAAILLLLAVLSAIAGGSILIKRIKREK